MSAVATLPRRADEDAHGCDRDRVEREQGLLAEVAKDDGDERGDDGAAVFRGMGGIVSKRLELSRTG